MIKHIQKKESFLSESISLGIDSEYFGAETNKIPEITKWFQHDAVWPKIRSRETKKRFTPLKT
ncbi:hypothetical protein AYB33_12475 [Leptospira santarosai]|uniref:Uncharacterized protein n=1 Tax=Leptospira santarosai serovar Arenal str. MAVJ 401 TaxID=1049976 RepID=M6JVQ6_9LEPT|nr:hypothetical protein LEP1GSC063_1357 [Leptospira santarosai serovar Arenal str. MAVJ 401]EMO84702.1 hypothetical protein LEP1GSC070_2756 [Leptospira santarosai str. AIM]KXZ32887.1 hypothetical protein AYB33_12475 [Leptospira santarosai]